MYPWVRYRRTSIISLMVPHKNPLMLPNIFCILNVVFLQDLLDDCTFTICYLNMMYRFSFSFCHNQRPSMIFHCNIEDLMIIYLKTFFILSPKNYVERIAHYTIYFFTFYHPTSCCREELGSQQPFVFSVRGYHKPHL